MVSEKKIFKVVQVKNNKKKLRILLNLTVFEIYAKNYCLTLCSIFCNSGHIFGRIRNPNSHFVKDTLRNINTKFHPNPSNRFRRKIVKNKDADKDDDTPSDGNSSYDLWPVWPGQLKTQ